MLYMILMEKIVPVIRGAKICGVMKAFLIEKPYTSFLVISNHLETDEGAFSCSVRSSWQHGKRKRQHVSNKSADLFVDLVK